MIEKVVYLEWEDSSSHPESGWHDVRGWEKYTPIICRSVGRVVFEDTRQIVITAHWHEEQMQGTMRIPKSAIRRRLVVLVKGKVQHGKTKK